MKKTLAILLSVVLILAMVPMSALVGAETTSQIWDNFFVKSEDAVIEDCTITSGSSITFKTTLSGVGSFVQLNQKLTDVIGGSGSVKVTIGENADINDYYNANFYLQFSANNTAADIVPVDDSEGAPNTNAISFRLFGYNNTHLMFTTKTDSGAGAKFYTSRLQTYPTDVTNGMTLLFPLNTDNNRVQIRNSSQGLINAGVSNIYTSNQTVADIGAQDGAYVRIRNNKEEEVTYTVTINSADVSSVYRDGNYIVSDMDSKVNSSSVTYADGKATYTYNVTLSGNGSYVQLDRKITDLIGGSGSVKVTVGENADINDYYNAGFYIQLTADATGKNIVPVDDSESAPNTQALSFRFFGYNSQYVMYTTKTASGSGAAYYSRRLNNSSTYTDVTNGMELIFPENAEKNNQVQIRCKRQDFINAGVATAYTSNQTVADINGQDGVYVRIRNNKDETVTYTLAVTTADTESRAITVTGGKASVETATYGTSVTLTPDAAPFGCKFTGWNVVSGDVQVADNAFTMGSAPVEIEAVYEQVAYIDGDYILSNSNSNLVDSSVTYADGKATYTATVELSGIGSYVQLNKKVTDLIGGSDTVKVTIGENADINDYYNSNFYIQLTADATGNDIVPKDDSASAPNTDALSFRLFGYNNQYLMFTTKTSSGAGAKYYTSRLGTHPTDVTNGMTFIFPENADDSNKVQIRSQRSDLINAGVAGIYTSNQTAADINGQDGVYVRIRNNKDEKVTYTFTVTTADTETRPITVTGGTASVETAGYGASVALTPNEAPRGYKFAGWNVVSGGVEIVDNAFIMGSEPVEIEAVYEETTYTDGNYILSDPNSKLVSSSVTRENGKVLYTATVELSGNGSYVQLNEKATDLIGGSDSVMVAIGENADINDYYNSNFYIQLTADATGNDIVPKDDSASAPNTDALSFRLFGYNNQYLMFTTKTSSGAGAKYYTSRLGTHPTDVTNGMTFIFPENADDSNKVQIRSQRSDLINAGVAGIYTSNQTAADINGQDGVYVRIRNNKDEKVTYTFTVTTVDAEAHTVTVTGGKANAETASSGTVVTLTPDEAPVGQTFAGWNVVSGGVEIADNSFVMGTEDVVVEAVFEKIDYTVTVDGEVFATVNYGDTVTLTVPEAATGYEFAGWNVVSGGVEIADNAFVMGTENVVIESTFEKIDYTVTVDGEVFATVNYGDTVTLEVPEVANGYTFAGWTVVSGGVEIADNAFVMGTENVVVTSKVEKIPYTVTVDGELQDGNVYVGDTVTLTPATPKDPYVKFDKWVIVSGEGASIEGNVLTIGTGNVEVEATFKAVEPFGDIRDLVRFDEVGADAPGVGGAFKALYTALDNIFNFSTIRNFLFGK